MNQEEWNYLIQAVAADVATRLNRVGDCDPDDDECSGVMYNPITIERFLRSGRTKIDQVVAGVIPVVPGQSVTLQQAAHPGWRGGCFSVRYRLANNAANHQDVLIKWFLDGIELDTEYRGAEIYDNNNNIIGDGYLPLPLANRKQCCIGSMNRLQVQISHTGAANQIEGISVHVNHGKRACCSACAEDKKCQPGCKGEVPKGSCATPQPPQMPPPVPMKVVPQHALPAEFKGKQVFIIEQG